MGLCAHGRMLFERKGRRITERLLVSCKGGKGAVRRFYEQIWNTGNLSMVPKLLHTDLCFRGSLGPVKSGHQEFIEYYESITGPLKEYDCDLQDMVEEDNRVFARVVFSGIHSGGKLLGYEATGMRVSWVGTALFTFWEGKIQDLWVLGDLHGLLQQLEGNAEAWNKG